MSHYQQIKFIELFKKHFTKDWSNKKILEIGSYDVNGTIRKYFNNNDYTGMDLIEGKGVDVVYDGKQIDFEEESFDLTLSCECFEHNKYYRENFLDMIKVTKKGGFVVFTCASKGRSEHGTSRTNDASPGSQMKWDYYKNLNKKDFEKLNLKNFFDEKIFFYNSISSDLYFIGIKKGDSRNITNFKDFTNDLIETNSNNIRLDENQPKRFIKKIFQKIRKFFDIMLYNLLSDKIYQNIIFYLKKIKL